MKNLRAFAELAYAPVRNRTRGSTGKFSLSKMDGIVLVFCATSISWAATDKDFFASLVSFDGANGANPQHIALIQATDGDFYGTTAYGGAYGEGTVFKMTLAGAVTTLYSFCTEANCTDGANPLGVLVQSSNGNFYGTTSAGGASSACAGGCGTFFEISAGGKLNTLYSFCSQTNCTDGANPLGLLIQATDGSFYGTTEAGGNSAQCTGGCGTVFEITGPGMLTTLHSFSGADGANPLGGVIQAIDGAFYGTASAGGANSDGTIFRITAERALTTMHSFDGTDGSLPSGWLVQAANGDFYGTTPAGGANGGAGCALPGVIGCGTFFEITPAGTLTTIYNFCALGYPSCSDGAGPDAGPVQATDGNFYGATVSGGIGTECAGNCGTFFKLTEAGTLYTLHSFDLSNGWGPSGGVVQDTNGSINGVTYFGGNLTCNAPNGCGTVYRMSFEPSVGIGPFVQTLPASGEVGAAVIILGTNLTGTTGVSFNGTAATFTVVSATEITTTVPAGATSGTVSVITPSGTLNSNKAFQVTP